MSGAIDIAGQRFGKLVAISRGGTSPHGAALWICKCDCGNTVVKRGASLRACHTLSCGCLHDELSSQRIAKMNTVHDLSKTRLYKIWTDMRKRCVNSKHWAFNRYGGRGITVCEEWQEFIPFYEWAMENGYEEHLTLDRVDNNQNYSPSNCRWATRKEQANNKSNTVLCRLHDMEYTISQLSDISGISRNTLYNRIFVYGWSVEKAVSVPVRGR